MAVPYTFGTATASIPLSNLDSNFATTITLGNTAIQLGNTVTTLNNMTLANVTVSSGSVTLTNIAVTTANVTTANIGTAVITGTSTLTGLTASTALALDASKNIASVTNTGSGNNVLGTSPTIATPTINTITSAASTALTLQSNNGNTAVTVDTSQNVGIGTTSPSYRLDVVGAGSPANGIMRISSNFTNSTTKYGYYTVGNYTNANLPFGFICGESNSTDNNVHIGGGAGEVTAATRIDFYTAANNNTAAGTERMRIDSSGNVLVGTTGQIKSSKQSIYSGATNATTYNTASFQGGSVLTVQNQQTTSVSTSAVTIATTGIYATLAIVFGSDGTNRFQDLIMCGLATGTVNVINSFTVGGTPASRTYSQSASTYRLAMGSGTYTIQFSGLSQGD